MKITKEQCTELVIQYLDGEAVSLQHWDYMRDECVKQAEGDDSRAFELLKEALEGFHYKFRDAVVKPGNVLHHFIGMTLELVDWDAVTQSRFDRR